MTLKDTQENRRGKHTKYLPYVFTEQGVAMLSSVLKSDTAISVSITIIKAFVAMRHLLQSNSRIFQRLETIENNQITTLIHQKETDRRIDELFDKMDKYKIEDRQGIFFQGQIYDAYSFFQKLLQKAQKEIVLIDNYIDLTVLDRLSDKNSNVTVTIYTKPDTKVTNLAVQRFNAQYPTLKIKHTTAMHDRFLILDNAEIYHIGASIKDLGKKCFAFQKIEDAQCMILEVLNRV